MRDGRPSAHFPRTLGDLRDLDGASVSALHTFDLILLEETIEYLGGDYDEFQALCSQGEGHLKKLNKFIQFCGVRYQMVSPFPVLAMT